MLPLGKGQRWCAKERGRRAFHSLSPMAGRHCTIWGLGRYSICKVFLTSGGSGGWRNTVSSDVLCCTSVCDTSPYNLAERSGSPDLSFWRQQRRHLQRPSWPPGSLPPAPEIAFLHVGHHSPYSRLQSSALAQLIASLGDFFP